MAPLPSRRLTSYLPIWPVSSLKTGLASLGSGMVPSPQGVQLPSRQWIRWQGRRGVKQRGAPPERRPSPAGPRRGDCRLSRLAGHREVGAAVSLPAVLARLRADRDLLAVRDGLQSFGGHPERDE